MPAPPYCAAKQHNRPLGARAWAAWRGERNRRAHEPRREGKGQARAAMRSEGARGGCSRRPNRKAEIAAPARMGSRVTALVRGRASGGWKKRGRLPAWAGEHMTASREGRESRCPHRGAPQSRVETYSGRPSAADIERRLRLSEQKNSRTCSRLHRLFFANTQKSATMNMESFFAGFLFKESRKIRAAWATRRMVARGR